MKISNPDRRSLLRATLAGAAATVVASPMRSALAQGAYPTRPIKLVVGFAPGGPTDILGRVIGKGMGDVLGEQVVIENRTGAGGNIGTDAVARSTPDGYTLLLTLLTGAVNESLFKNFKTRFAEHFEFDRRHCADRPGAGRASVAAGEERVGPDQVRQSGKARGAASTRPPAQERRRISPPNCSIRSRASS